MKIGILDCSAGFETNLLNYFSKLQHFGKIITDSELIDALPLSFLPPQNSNLTGETRYDCFILNIKAFRTVEKTLEVIFQNYESTLWRPKIILISNLTSWSGKHYHVAVGGSISEFTSRVPIGKEIQQYKLENKFHSCAMTTGMQMCLVSSGLIYGGRGFDLHNLFRTLWESTPDKVNLLFSVSNGKNYIPMIHFQDLVDIVGHLSISVQTPAIPFFVPATDGSSSNLSVIAERLSLVSKRKVEVMKKEEAIDFILNYEEGEVNSICPHRQWNLDLRFSDSARLIHGVHLRFPNGMVDFIADVWKEYVSACATEPCSFLVSGPPSSLKTTISKELANKLQIAYIDPIDAMKFVIDIEDSHETIDRTGGAKATDLNHTLDLALIAEPSVALKIELGRVLTVQLNGEKKKGKNTDETPIDLKSVNWTPTLVAAIPSELIRRCAQIKISEDMVCARMGYVLDLWGHIRELEHIYEVTGTVPNMEDPKIRKIVSQLPSFTLEGFDDLSPTSKGSVSPRPNNSNNLKSAKGNSQKLPQVIIELQSPDNVTVDRTLASLGCEPGAKLSKDHQAVVKELETKLAQYSSTLVERTLANGTICKTSSTLGMLQDLGYNIQRVDVSHLNGRGEGDPIERNRASITQIVDTIYETYSAMFGTLPWVSSQEERPATVREQGGVKLVDNNFSYSESPNHMEQEENTPKSTTAQQLSQMNDDLKQKAIENANQLQNYLVENVLPHVAEALVVISRERVQDPVLYLAQFLYQRGLAVQEQETTAAYEKYLSAVKEAEAMEEEAAAQLLALSQKKVLR